MCARGDAGVSIADMQGAARPTGCCHRPTRYAAVGGVRGKLPRRWLVMGRQGCLTSPRLTVGDLAAVNELHTSPDVAVAAALLVAHCPDLTGNVHSIEAVVGSRLVTRFARVQNLV